VSPSVPSPLCPRCGQGFYVACVVDASHAEGPVDVWNCSRCGVDLVTTGSVTAIVERRAFTPAPDLIAELSQAKGEIEAAHVELNRVGVHRSEGESLQDRIGRLANETETKLEALTEACAVKDAALAEESTFVRMWEARATAAEQERDRLRDWQATVTAALQHPGGAFYMDVAQHVRDLRAKLAAAERREAELRKVAYEFYMRGKGHNAPWPVEQAMRAALGMESEALASPSTPSPAPSAKPQAE
jgi:hypothetical protein